MDHEQQMYEIILHAGNARTHAFEALDAVEEFDFAKAEKLLAQANRALSKAHQTQTKLIQAELNGQGEKTSLLMIHAQDHLMTAMSEQKLIERIVRLVKKMRA